MAFGAIYPLYVQKVERKGRTREELDEVITWLTGYDHATIDEHVRTGTPLPAFSLGYVLTTGVLVGAVLLVVAFAT